MSKGWRFLHATSAEQAAFPDLATTLALPWLPAAQPNRLRHVRRVRVAAGTYFVKVFARTQWKNRLRALWAAPHVARDGEREAAVAQALQDAGFETARPVALGVDGPRSVYICAELPGGSLLARLRGGTASSGLLRAAARWAGAIARAGFVLPDLKLEHVHVLGDAPPRFGVLDLHNGRTRARLGRRDALRWLRHMRRESAGLALPPRLELGAAALLLRAAGLGPDRRALLAAFAPLDTHSRYELPGRSERYRQRNPARARSELALLEQVWPGHAGDLVLDVPCGAARFWGPLAGRWFGLDRALAMARQAAVAAGRCIAVATAEQLPVADRGVDGVLQFRFLHHLAPEQARAAVAEATRVARRFVVVSHFDPWAVHGLRRRLARGLLGRPHTRHSVSRTELRRWFAAHGFVERAAAKEPPGWRELRVVRFERDGTQAFLRPAAFNNESNA